LASAAARSASVIRFRSTPDGANSLRSLGSSKQSGHHQEICPSIIGTFEIAVVNLQVELEGRITTTVGRDFRINRAVD